MDLLNAENIVVVVVSPYVTSSGRINVHGHPRHRCAHCDWMDSNLGLSAPIRSYPVKREAERILSFSV